VHGLNGDDYTVVDTRLSIVLKPTTIFVEASNLFNATYSEIRDLPMPGRWIKAGVRLDLIALP
jgi:iron complex outermembrane receptor protein